MRKNRGFTIIELVVVITILGILAAVAIPRFFDLQDDARLAAVQGVAGAVASGAAMNYGTWLAKGGGAVAAPVQTVNACTTGVLGNVMVGAWPTGVTVEDAPATPLAAAMTDGTIGNCRLRHAGNTGIFVDVGIIKLD